MKIVLATSNKGKVREIKELLHDRDVFAYTDLIEPFEIVEDGETFKENALIKARAVYAALGDPEAIVIADDSGISVDVLDGAPGIYSARYGGENATDKDNMYKLIEAVKAKRVDSSQAHYTAAIAIASREGESCVHGWMYGDVITQSRGENGFGYDPIFVPDGFQHTLGELPSDVKVGLSHRSKALNLAKILIDQIKQLRLDEYEHELLESVENGEWKSKGNIDERLKSLQSYIKNQNKKAISIRISENDIYELKKKALENSIPYQNLIQMLIHQFATNKIKLSV